MTRTEFLFVLLISIQLALADDKWVWSSNSEKKNNEQFEFDSVNSESSDSAIKTIDNIIIMGRSGRKIPGFDSLYDDPDTYQALTHNNETFARSAIAQKVCSLKLTNCDDNVARHYGFGYNSPSYNNLQQVIVAQPVALKPVGRPIQAIPIGASVHAGPQPIPYSGKTPIGGFPFGGQPIHKPLLPNLVGSIGVNRPLTHAPLPPPHHRPISHPYVNTVQETQHIHHHYHHSDISSSNNHFNTIGKPVYEGQDFIGNGYYKDQQFLDCDCVPLYQCDDDFKRRSLNQQHLAIDPRAPNVDISIEESNETNSENDSPRHKRDIEYSNEEDEKSRSIQEKKFTEPIKRSCQNGYVCCPNRNARKLISEPQCGVRNIVPITGRVKNEEPYSGDSDFGEYPWQVAILKNDNNDGQVYVSGGVLISDKHVLTSAHNLYESKARTENLILRLGEYDVRSEEEQYRHIDTKAEKVLIHPSFNKVTLQNDIALITLRDRVNFAQNIHITPACMPSKYTDYVGQRCWTTGWGKDDQKNGHYQNILKEVDLPIIDSSTCQSLLQRERLGSHFNLHDGFICAGGEAGKDACKGDGGSPLVCESKNGRMEVVGLVSWGLDCGRATVPGVYTKVSHYSDWIKSNIQKEQYFI